MIEKASACFKTSAAISKGNSGGGLFDGEGRLLGITTFKLQGGENLNFAVDAQHLLAIDKALLSANLIRAGYERKVVRPGDDNDLDERFIESPALTKWLLDRKAVDGSPLYEYVERSVTRTARSGGKLFAAGHPEFDALLQTFLQTRPRTPTTQAQAPGGFRLSCPMHASSDGSFQFDLTISADPGASLVNGAPAKFSDAEVVFRTGKDMAFTAVLDRYSGRVSISSERFPRMLNGSCVRVAERQF